jgi:FAD/FMN-containing dehydrogenase
MDLTKELAEIAGTESVATDDSNLENYSVDQNLIKTRKPSCVVYVKNTEEVRDVVRYANKSCIPVTPRSSLVRFYGASVPSQGGILMDLSRMNRILAVDEPDLMVKIEPGVTWAQLQKELEKYGMMVCQPLLPHGKKSVLTSALEREPIIIPKYEYNETFLSGEVVLGNGALFYLGSAMGKSHKGGSPEGFLPSARLFTGAQGTLGVITWANLKAAYLPAMDKLFFIPFENIENLIKAAYRIQRLMLGNECFALNSLNLAAILAGDTSNKLEVLRASLPPWTLILCLSGFKRQPQGRIEYEEEALMNISSELNFKPSTSLPGVTQSGDTIINMLRKPWAKDTYWKNLYKGACRDVFFHTTMNRVPEFNNTMETLSYKHGYLNNDISFYLQPIEQGRICYCQYGFHFDPDDAAEAEKVHRLYLEASETVTNMGGIFTTPYGPQAEMVYSRAAAFPRVMKVVKNAVDPNNIMNPGKLCI